MIKRFSKIKAFFLSLAIVFSVVSFGLVLPSEVYADEDEAAKSGLWMSPVNNVIPMLDPGAVYNGTVVISNTGTEKVSLSTEILPYQVDRETYKSVYTINNSYTQITRWITAEIEKDTLDPGEQTNVNYTIKVPSDAPGGGQYAAISIHSEPLDKSKANISTTTTANFIIFSRVSGVTRETGEIIEQKVSGFLLAPPIKASVKLSNTGNVDQDAKITVEIENAITGAKLYSNADSPKETSLLPETEKTVDMTFDNVLRLGVMRVTMTTDYINNHEKISRIVIIIPIWLIFILIAVVLLIIYKIASKKHNNSKKRSNSRGYETPSKDFNI